MANAVYQFDRQTDAMRTKIRAYGLLQEAIQLLTRERLIEIQRRGDTDGSSDTHYAALAVAGVFAAGGFATANQAARKSFEAMDNLLAKLTVNTSVVDVANTISDVTAQHGI